MKTYDPREDWDDDTIPDFDVDSDYADEEHDHEREEMDIIREQVKNKN